MPPRHGRETRLSGDVRSRRKRHPSAAARQKLAAHIRRQQPIKPAVDATPCRDRWLARVGSVIDAVVQALPTLGPVTAMASTVPDVASGTSDQIFVSHFDFRGYAAPDEAASHRDVVPVLRRFFNATDVTVAHPPTRITVVPKAGDGVPYLRNLAAGTSDGQLLLSGVVPPNYMSLLEALTRFLQARAIPHRMTDYPVNLANVDHLPEADLLVLADAPPHDILAPASKADLVRRYGHPAHVIHLELADRRNDQGAPLCYDLDLAFHATLNARGEPVALVHLPCIQVQPAGSAIGRQQVVARLAELGFRVIEVDAADQRALATNALGDGRGRLLMSGPAGSLSPSLVSRLEQAGVSPVFPDRLWLGHPAVDEIPPYGLHCLTTHLRWPRAADATPVPSVAAPHTDL